MESTTSFEITKITRYPYNFEKLFRNINQLYDYEAVTEERQAIEVLRYLYNNDREYLIQDIYDEILNDNVLKGL